jgi:hypothetical protein
MSICPQPYQGNDPYLFISYAHADRDRVFPELEVLARRGYRFWYDDGIQPSAEWPQEIADALGRAFAVLIFISSAAVESQNVRNEIHFALNNKKALFPVQLEDVALPLGLALRMGDIQAILKWRLEPDDYWRRLLHSLPAGLQTPLNYSPIWSAILPKAAYSSVLGIVPLGREILFIASRSPDRWIHALWARNGHILWWVDRGDHRKSLERLGWDLDYLYVTGEISVEQDLTFAEKYWLREGDKMAGLAWYDVPPHLSQKYQSIPEWDSIEWHELSQLERVGRLNTTDQWVRLMERGGILEFQIGGRIGTWKVLGDEITAAETQNDGTIVVAMKSGRVCLLGAGSR